jgi:predicted HicB family RNase H-like nuclease
MTALRYKDFQGSVEFDDNKLIIRILHIDDFIVTEIDSAAEAQAAFEELVDDYLVTCRELGKEPCKPFKGSFNVRISPELHRRVVMAAADEGESMNAWIAAALEARIERQKTKKTMLDRPDVLRLLSPESRVAYTRVDTLHVRHHADPWGSVRAARRELPVRLLDERQRVN